VKKEREGGMTEDKSKENKKKERNRVKKRFKS
jgi:hypothetical protein